MLQKLLLLFFIVLLLFFRFRVGAVCDVKVEFVNHSYKLIQFQSPQFDQYSSSFAIYWPGDRCGRFWSKINIKAGFPIEIQWHECEGTEGIEWDARDHAAKGIQRQTLFVPADLQGVNTIRFVFTPENGWHVVLINGQG